jgi:hypothetical protein
MLGNFCKIYRDLRGCDSDRDTVEYTSSNEHPFAIACDLEGSSEKPEDTRVQKGITTADLVRKRSSNDGSDY